MTQLQALVYETVRMAFLAYLVCGVMLAAWYVGKEMIWHSQNVNT